MVVDVALVAFALSVGAATFFSPCAVALLPAYAAFFTGTTSRERDARPLFESAWMGARFGAAAAVGALFLFVVGTAAVFLLRTQLGVVQTPELARAFTVLGVGVGVVLIGLGVLMLSARAPSVTLPLRAPERKTMGAMVTFGGLFALGSMACTLPLLFGVIGAAITQPPAGSVLVMGAYGVGLAGLLFVASVALSVAEDQARTYIRRAQRYVKPVGGALLVGAGAFVVYYYVRYGFW